MNKTPSKQLKKSYQALNSAAEDFQRILDIPKLETLIEEQVGKNIEEIQITVISFLTNLLNTDEQAEFNDIYIDDIPLEENLKIDAAYFFLSLTPLILDQLQDYIAHLVAKIQQHPLFQQAFQAYKQNNQQELAKILPKLGYHEKHPKTVYHGIQVLSPTAPEENITSKNMLSPDKYVDLIKSILKQGLISGINTDSLPGLEATFVIDSPVETYGFAGIVFIPFQNHVWQLSSAESAGLQIISPRIDPKQHHFQVFIRDISFWDYLKNNAQNTRDIFGDLNKKKCKEYLDTLQNKLTQAKIPFHIIYPPH